MLPFFECGYIFANNICTWRPIKITLPFCSVINRFVLSVFENCSLFCHGLVSYEMLLFRGGLLSLVISNIENSPMMI
jgi:hypothetical protein